MPRSAPIGILALFSFTASAAELPNLAVVGLHQAELDLAAQAEVVQRLGEAVEEVGTLNALASEEFAGTIAGREDVILQDGLLGEGRSKLADGRNFYNQAQHEDAILMLRQAVENLQLGMAAANDTRDLWDAYIYLGTSYLRLQVDNKARQSFAVAAALNPARSPSPATFPPEVIELYTTVVSELKPDAVTLEIKVEEPNAAIYLNGEAKGTGSVKVSGVLPGVHHVLARVEGLQAYTVVPVMAPSRPVPPEGEEAPGTPVERKVEAPRVIDVSLKLDRPSLGAAGGSAGARQRQTSRLYKAVGAHASGVDLVLLAGVDEGMLHMQLYAPQADSFSKSMDVPYADSALDEAIETLPQLLNLVDKQGVLTETSPLAAPLDIGSNTELASLLIHPRKGVEIDPARRRTALPIILGGAGLVTAGAAVITIAIITEPPATEIRDGNIKVGPF